MERYQKDQIGWQVFSGQAVLVEQEEGVVCHISPRRIKTGSHCTMEAVY